MMPALLVLAARIMAPLAAGILVLTALSAETGQAHQAGRRMPSGSYWVVAIAGFLLETGVLIWGLWGVLHA